MKTFVYGRPSVEGGDRGYRIFQHQGLTPDEVMGIGKCLSDEDPDVRRLAKAHFLPFFAWFPWQDGQWVFGKGRIEARGKLGAMYYSYLFHGVVLDERRRAALAHNPFVLADFIDPSEERRAQPPLIPDKINQKGLLLNLHNKAVALKDNEPLAHACGSLAEAMTLSTPAPQTLVHDGGFDGAYWGVFFALLPPSLRAQVSLTTWGPFLPGQTTLSVTPEPQQQFDPRKQGKSVFIDLIHRLAAPDQQQEQAYQLQRYEAVAEDLLAGNASTDAKLKHLENWFRAMERPSVQSLKLIPPAGPRAFPYKAEHLVEVWNLNGPERKLFPDLADKLLISLHRDYTALDEGMRQKQLPFWENLIKGLGNNLSHGALLVLLQDPLLCGKLAPHFSHQRLLAALADGHGDGELLSDVLAVIQAQHPEGSKIFGKLIHLLWGRFLNHCRRKDATKALAADNLLEACYQLQPQNFVRHSSQLLQNRSLGYAPPFLSKRPHITACLKAWAAAVGNNPNQQGSQALHIARVRLVACLKGVYGPLKNWPPEVRSLDKLIQDNWLMKHYYLGGAIVFE